MKTPHIPLNQINTIGPEYILAVLTKSYALPKTNKDKHGNPVEHPKPQPTLELAAQYYRTLKANEEATRHLNQQFPDGLRFISVGKDKVCKAKKFDREDYGWSSVDDLAKQLWRPEVDGLGLLGGKVGDNKFLVFVDIDQKDTTIQQKILQSLLGTDGKTFLTTTPSGGVHAYFWSNTEVPCYFRWSGEQKAKIDIKGAGGYVIAPGSTLEKGPYRHYTDNHFFSKMVAELPSKWEEALNQFLRVPRPKATKTKSFDPMGLRASSSSLSTPSTPSGYNGLVPENSRYPYLLSRAGRLIHQCTEPAHLWGMLHNIREREFENPHTFGDNEIDKIVSGLFKKEYGEVVAKASGSSLSTYTPSLPCKAVFRDAEWVQDYKNLFLNHLTYADGYATSMKDINKLYRAHMEYGYGHPYAKDPDQTALSFMLKSKGFTNKPRTKRRVSFWNVDLSAAEALVERESEPGTPTAHEAYVARKRQEMFENYKVWLAARKVQQQAKALAAPISDPPTPVVLTSTAPTAPDTGDSTPSIKQRIWEEKRRHEERAKPVMDLIDRVGWEAALNAIFYPPTAPQHSV